ncbi:MAG: ribokinase, partial [Acidimicrobiales bacterium]
VSTEPVGGRVVVVGSVNVDVVLRVDRLPTAGQTVIGGTRADHPGGKGANPAVAAARMGARVSFVGAVGADGAGREARALLEAEGVDTSWLSEVTAAPTGTAVVVVDSGGENQIAVASGANGLLSGDRVTSALDHLGLGPSDVCLACFEVTDAAVAAAASGARAAGAYLVVNPAPARALRPELAAGRPILTPNRLEALRLLGAPSDSGEPEGSPDDLAGIGMRLSRSTGAAVVITLGAQGALVCEGAGSWAAGAPEADVVDTTGAGDTFNGVLAASLAEGLELRPSVLRSLRAASMSVTKAGARSAMPSRAALDGTA